MGRENRFRPSPQGSNRKALYSSKGKTTGLPNGRNTRKLSKDLFGESKYSHFSLLGVIPDMEANHIPITQEQFDKICTSTGWEIQEIPMDTLRIIPRIVRPDDHIGGYISGSHNQPKTLNNYRSIAAFEVLVFERNPKPEWEEGPINAYHYVIRNSGHFTYPYILSGPYVDETIIGHHPDDLDLNIYNQ